MEIEETSLHIQMGGSAQTDPNDPMVCDSKVAKVAYPTVGDPKVGDPKVGDPKVGDPDPIEQIIHRLSKTRLCSDTGDCIGDSSATDQMISAISNDQPMFLQRMLEQGRGDPSAKNTEGYSLIHILFVSWGLRCISKEGFLSILNLLIRHGADLNATDPRGVAPIHLSVVLDSPIEAIPILIANGADPCLPGERGSLALHAASFFGYEDRLLLLLSTCRLFGLKQNMDTQDEDGCTALILAAKEGHRGTVWILLQHGATIDKRSNKGFDALQYACCFDNPDVALYLLRCGADPNPSIDGEQPNPIHFCSEQGDQLMVQQLIAHGATIDCTDDLGRTPLVVAMSNRRTGVVLQLLHAGASTTAGTKWAIDLAPPGPLRELIRSKTRMIQ